MSPGGAAMAKRVKLTPCAHTCRDKTACKHKCCHRHTADDLTPMSTDGNAVVMSTDPSTAPSAVPAATPPKTLVAAVRGVLDAILLTDPLSLIVDYAEQERLYVVRRPLATQYNELWSFDPATERWEHEPSAAPKTSNILVTDEQRRLMIWRRVLRRVVPRLWTRYARACWHSCVWRHVECDKVIAEAMARGCNWTAGPRGVWYGVGSYAWHLTIYNSITGTTACIEAPQDIPRNTGMRYRWCQLIVHRDIIMAYADGCIYRLVLEDGWTKDSKPPIEWEKVKDLRIRCAGGARLVFGTLV
jgi:hypothetical protein